MSTNRESWWQPGKLWSLWDLMDTFPMGGFMSGYHAVASFAAAIANRPETHTGTITDGRSGHLGKAISDIIPLLDQHDMPVSAIMARIIHEKLGTEGVTLGEALGLLQRLHGRISAELVSKQFLIISPGDAHLFEKPRLFGEDVERAFPIANDDIEEAGSCIALGRGSAAVFHLMRVMEAGLKSLAAELGIPYAPSWEAYIRQLNTVLDSKNYANLTEAQKAKRSFYLDVLGDLEAVKIAWRNPTMHIVKSYDIKQARRIWDAVEGLMQHLASNLVQAGNDPISTGPNAI